MMLFNGSWGVVERNDCHDTQNPPSAAVLSQISAEECSMFARENLDERVAERAGNPDCIPSPVVHFLSENRLHIVGPGTWVIEI